MGESAPNLVLRVTPRSAVPGVGPWRHGVLQVRVTRPPTRGQATGAALAALAATLDVPPSAVRLVQGARSRHKRVAVDGLTSAELARRLSHLADAPE